jgi:hypothetical protein
MVPFPSNEHTLMLYVASAFQRLSFKTLKVYLAGIQYASIIKGYPLSLVRMHRLYYAVRGIRRIQGNSFSRPIRAPILLSHLGRLRCFFNFQFAQPDNYMLEAASLIAFYGLLRSSEYLAPSTASFDPHHNLQLSDIFVASDGSHITVNIKQSKTDPFKQGCTIKIWAISTSISCPVSSLCRYIRHLTYPSGPLFVFKNGTYLTRRKFAHLIQQCLPNINLNTHSFRIGGASAAFAAGIPETTIRLLGRWASDAYRVYIRIPDNTIREACLAMSRPNATNHQNLHIQLFNAMEECVDREQDQ